MSIIKIKNFGQDYHLWKYWWLDGLIGVLWSCLNWWGVPWGLESKTNMLIEKFYFLIFFTHLYCLDSTNAIQFDHCGWFDGLIALVVSCLNWWGVPWGLESKTNMLIENFFHFLLTFTVLFWGMQFNRITGGDTMDFLIVLTMYNIFLDLTMIFNFVTNVVIVVNVDWVLMFCGSRMQLAQTMTLLLWCVCVCFGKLFVVNVDWVSMFCSSRIQSTQTMAAQHQCVVCVCFEKLCVLKKPAGWQHKEFLQYFPCFDVCSDGQADFCMFFCFCKIFFTFEWLMIAWSIIRVCNLK